jgi:hypothetical protein
MSRILLSYIGYPLSVGRFLKKALRNLGHEVIHCGPFAGGTLPWQPQTDFSRYADKPELLLPAQYQPISLVLEQVGKVDLVIQCDAQFFLTGKCPVPNIVWAIDNHVRKYDATEFDVFFGAHSWGFGADKKNFKWLPCAYSQADHFQTGAAKAYDLVFLGVVYQHRAQLLNELAKLGKVAVGMGVLGEQYNSISNQGRIGLCYSAQGDLPMRVFENAAQGLMIFADRQRDLEKMGLRDGTHYVGFASIEEAVMQFAQLMREPQRVSEIAKAGKLALCNETYEARARTILSSL